MLNLENLQSGSNNKPETNKHQQHTASPTNIPDLAKLLANKQQNNETNIDYTNINKAFNQITQDGYDQIIKTHKKASRQINNINNDNQEIREQQKQVRKKLDETLFGFIHDELSNHLAKWDLLDRQLDLSMKQTTAQEEGKNMQTQLQYMQQAQSERQKNIENETEEEDDNPLISSNYLQRIFQFVQDDAQKERQLVEDDLKVQGETLQKDNDKFTKQMQRQKKEKATKQKQLSNALEKINHQKEQNRKKKRQLYSQLRQNNKRYGKMLGLREKYYQKINATHNEPEVQTLLHQYHDDINKMARASRKALKQEDAKFNSRGDRIETAEERKTRKLQAKEKRKQNKQAEKIKTDRQTNNTNMSQPTNDAIIQKAYRENNSKTKKPQTLNIQNIKQSKTIQSSVNNKTLPRTTQMTL